MVEIWDNFERVFELMDAVVEIDGEEMFAIEVGGERLLTWAEIVVWGYMVYHRGIYTLINLNYLSFYRRRSFYVF